MSGLILRRKGRERPWGRYRGQMPSGDAFGRLGDLRSAAGAGSGDPRTTWSAPVRGRETRAQLVGRWFGRPPRVGWATFSAGGRPWLGGPTICGLFAVAFG